jgi:hypothetical protein
LVTMSLSWLTKRPENFSPIPLGSFICFPSQHIVVQLPRSSGARQAVPAMANCVYHCRGTSLKIDLSYIVRFSSVIS